ncbi:mannose-1-phosphate guanylyltransferase/mannose-6-phosphate isomerase [Albidovulum sediminicola]|uniref:mannose-1-phosphate guanylyltransferase n=1 Tax=Albidovulum sediminicola TaxID=2984331 RepID=A0ABT2Z4H7_9RHOB|nr:mannose-1-phosphate guanylyltransferase/mannose-6-phosphate isomerase [Defluviimonas sp. WL0075]MCV2866049.1 mannose-1-phosphate guanylyltransferase/mannose-6-phosphate isomerase [Defluviimonas sp. WL0075]
MTPLTIHPVLLCGGSGTRLWPISRRGYPKQFANVLGSSSLFKDSVNRLRGPNFANPIVVTGEDLRFLVTEQLAEVGREPDAILIEPEGRNTAPAVLAAALWIERNDPDALMLVTPSDHVIPDDEEFRAAVAKASNAAQDGALVTFGIAPTRAETGYGWLELQDARDRESPCPKPLVRFVEKPQRAVAEQMLDSGKFMWNAGIFLFSVKAILEAYRRHVPEMIEGVKASLDGADGDLDFLRLAEEPWSKVESESIDYAIMEHEKNLVVMPFNRSWSDLGGWEAVWLESNPNFDGNVVSENALAINCKRSLLRSESAGQELVGIGLENIVAVTMPDAVLVANMSDNQRVKEAVAILKERGKRQAEDYPRDHRPWGWFESLAIGGRFQVKRIVVKPGGVLSLQSHFHRSEHWIVVEGTARITVGDEVKLVPENQSVYIPVGTIHRMENPGKVNMVLIEVQTGTYLGEDDIVRYEDIYSRK